MACPAFGSTSQVSLYWDIDPDPTLPLPETAASMAWKQIRMTGETLDISLTSAVSEEITPQRSYSGSLLTQGEIVGGFNFEATLGVLKPFLISVLQDPTALGAWADTGSIKNGSTKNCLTFMKVIDLGATKNYYIYRGVQISSLSLNMEAGALITGEVSIMGIGGDVRDTIPVEGTNWILTSAAADPLMSAVDSLENFDLQDSTPAAVPVTFQSFSLVFDNQMRQQFAVGHGSIFAAGTASSRFLCTFSSTQYYANHAIYDALLADEVLSLTFDLKDSNTDGFGFEFGVLKIQDGAVPLAGGPDADLLISPNLQAFEDAVTGTVKITLDETP